MGEIRAHEDLAKSISANDGYKTQLPIYLTPDQVRITRANEAFWKVSNELLQRFPGLSVVNTDAEGAREATKNTLTPWRGESAFFLGDTIYTVGDQLTPDIAFHEFSHPFIRSIRINNPELFNRIYNDLSLTSEGKTITAQVSKDHGAELPEE